MENRPKYKINYKMPLLQQAPKSAANNVSYIPKSANILLYISRRCLHNDALQLGETTCF